MSDLCANKFAKNTSFCNRRVQLILFNSSVSSSFTDMQRPS